MGGETQRLRLALQNGAWEFQRLQSFKDHQKQVTCIRFSPDGQHFVTISRDRVANFYRRGKSEVASGDFELLGTRTMAGEVTAVCWLDKTTSVLAARDDHELHYFEMGQKVEESLCVNLNALGDKVVSFTVLALSASKDGSMVAACTDRARVIVLQARSSRQLRNLYGAAVNEYDVPSICFSLDDCFLYVTSSLPQPSGAREQEEVVALCGQVAIFELRTAQLVLQLPCHQKAVRCFDRHPFTEMLVTGSFDKTASETEDAALESALVALSKFMPPEKQALGALRAALRRLRASERAALREAGPMAALPRRAALEPQLRQVLEEVEAFVARLGRPRLVTLARSVVDGFCPMRWLCFLESGLLEALQRLFGQLEVIYSDELDAREMA
ncbi:unnamed protein product [Effrenium voratum]|uniref:Uncharacterized protein n=1 Tax=Effrenium voratum TaxID=2562239 RepID=A0AA36IZ54_9DINO|nr:unnamed protein product [Effrenium voratum]